MIHKGYEFNSQVQAIAPFKSDWTQNEIKSEPMMFNCSVEFAQEKGGPLTQEFLRSALDVWRYNHDDLIIDSRVHMLMPGWYPCIPGFHHDDVARDSSGQPNYDRQPYKSRHVLGLVNSEIAPTVFAVGKHTLPKVSGDLKVYKEWHPIVEAQIRGGLLNRVEAKSGWVYEFDWQTMHAGQKAVGTGWRWFIRVTERRHTFTNEIRNQVNVYLDAVNAGW